MFKCTVCGYIHDGEEAPQNCPKCGAPKEKFEQIQDEAMDKIVRSRFTNDLHMELKSLLNTVVEVAEAGIDDELDPGCVAVFQKARTAAIQLGQMVKAEIEGHMKKGKWG